MNFQAEPSRTGSETFALGAVGRALGEEAFHRMISIERRRTTRSRKTFLLMLLDMGDSTTNHRLSLRKILSTLAQVLRETDITGWYKQDTVVGVMFTEITLDDEGSTSATLMRRVSQALKSHLTSQQFHQTGISFHLLPETRAHKPSSLTPFPAVYPGVSVPSAATGPSL